MLNIKLNTFEQLESNVRSYCRNFTDTFEIAKNFNLYTKKGKEYIDFFAGAGALNYGHNNDFIKKQILTYIESDKIMHGLDMYTTAKEDFLQSFFKLILNPKKLDYKVQFCGPTGTNAIEAALKIARKSKKRTGIFSFTGGFHGMSLGSLSATSNGYHRNAAGVNLSDVTFMPYPTDFPFDTIEYIEALLTDSHSGVSKPAAIIFETVQAEGGVNIAPIDWIRKLRQLCDKHDILLICDDIQVGCGRTGNFFSFERADIIPDIVVLSKSISGYGLPMSILLIKPELDIWEPAEHNGTFRGNQLAFIGATAALKFREIYQLDTSVKSKGTWLEEYLNDYISSLDEKIIIRGLGLIWGIDLSGLGQQSSILAKEIASCCYENGLLIERVGRNDTVLKIMPPLTINIEGLEKGCTIMKNAIEKNILQQVKK